MQALEERIRKSGRILKGGILKVDSFVNHQIDIHLLMQMADEMCRIFSAQKIDRVLTIEASGIAMAALVAERLEVPLVFAKKSKTKNVDGEFYSAMVHSYTHGNDNRVIVAKPYINAGESVLIVDDFLASGEAFLGLTSIVEQAGASVSGCCAIIAKANQGGMDVLRKKGYKVEALATIATMNEETGEFTFA